MITTSKHALLQKWRNAPVDKNKEVSLTEKTQTRRIKLWDWKHVWERGVKEPLSAAKRDLLPLGAEFGSSRANKRNVCGISTQLTDLNILTHIHRVVLYQSNLE